MSLRRNFFVYLHFTSLFTLWREHELRKRQSKFLQNINTLQVKNFALKVLCELFFLILYFFFFLVSCYPTQISKYRRSRSYLF